MLLTLLAFVVALGLLIAIHEYGHYRVAVACGVKVLRFSVGFGRVIVRWQPRNQKHGQSTEFVIGAFPLGGYVKMLDEREGPVSPEERHLAFNTQSLKSRALIVAAGPVANLLLAVLLYSVLNWWGMQEPRAILASPVPGSVAEKAGLRGGELVEQAGFDGESLEPVRSFDDVRWLLTKGALDGRDVRLVTDGRREYLMALGSVQAREADPAMFRRIGVMGPWTKPEIAEVVAGGAAARAGLQIADTVLAVDGVQIVDGMQLFELIRKSGGAGKVAAQHWRVDRGGKTVELQVTPALVKEDGVSFGRIGARVNLPPATVEVSYGAVDGLWRAVQKTWDMSALTLRMMGKMLVGEASLKNLSGPITIAEYAGKSASMGLAQYMLFLAIISVSLGVLNLLPVPVLDGGHLMYYLWEGVTGRSVSDAWMERLQRSGVAVLLVMMSIALFNDVSRHIPRLFG